MAETVRGGLYLGEDGRWHDAEGRVLEAPGAVPEQGQVDGMDAVDVVDGEAESAPAAAPKKRGK